MTKNARPHFLYAGIPGDKVVKATFSVLKEPASDKVVGHRLCRLQGLTEGFSAGIIFALHSLSL